MNKLKFARKRVLPFLCIMLLSISLRGQEASKGDFSEKRISIEKCQQWAMENYPAIKQHDLLDKAREYTLSNISRVYRPEFSLSGVASWQSERMKLDLKMPKTVNVSMDLNGPVSIPVSIPEMSIPVSDQDRYNVSLMLKQALWTGGRVKAGKQVAESEIDMMHAGLDAQLYEIKDKVKELYFGLLTIEGKEKQLDCADEILDSLHVRAEAALKDGVIYETDLDVIEVERIKYRQLRLELEAKREACLGVLSMLIHRPLSKETELQVPEVSLSM